MAENVTRNANSGAAASASSQITATGKPQALPDGTFPVSALAQLLTGKLDGPAGDEQGPGAGENQRVNEGANGEPLNDGNPRETESNENPAEEPAGTQNAEAAEGAQSHEGETANAEGATGTGEEAGAGANGVEKRIEQLLGQVRGLQEQLAELKTKPAEAGAANGNGKPHAVEQITDLNQLQTRFDTTNAALREANGLLRRLQHNPTKVAEVLKAQGIELKDGEGNEDYSTERMAEALSDFASQCEETLAVIPKRAQWIQQHAQAHAQVVKLKPWVADKADERHALMSDIVRQFPALRSQPNYEYWLACCVEGHLATQKAKAAAAKPVIPNKARPNSGAVGGGGARTNGDKVAAAKKAVVQQGSRTALAGFLQVTGAIR